MAQLSMRPCGDFRTTYKSDTPIFETKTIRSLAIAGVIAMLAAPLVLDIYFLNLFIQIAYLGIAALGLNILVGFTGQISLGHGAFFGFGAFASAWLNNQFNIPVVFAIPLAGYLTMIVGMLFGLPAARIKGLYLAIATLAAQFILKTSLLARSGSVVVHTVRVPAQSTCLASSSRPMKASSMLHCLR